MLSHSDLNSKLNSSVSQMSNICTKPSVQPDFRR